MIELEQVKSLLNQGTDDLNIAFVLGNFFWRLLFPS